MNNTWESYKFSIKPLAWNPSLESIGDLVEVPVAEHIYKSVHNPVWDPVRVSVGYPILNSGWEATDV